VCAFLFLFFFQLPHPLSRPVLLLLLLLFFFYN
jgi:hypothetical protein